MVRFRGRGCFFSTEVPFWVDDKRTTKSLPVLPGPMEKAVAAMSDVAPMRWPVVRVAGAGTFNSPPFGRRWMSRRNLGRRMALSSGARRLIRMRLAMVRDFGRRIVGRKRDVDMLLRVNRGHWQNNCEKERGQSQSRLHLSD
jgi:hypothetical protein